MVSKGIQQQRLRVVESNPPPHPEPGPSPTDTPESGPAPQWQAMVQECNQLLAALAGYGIDMRDIIDPRQLRPRVEGFSCCRMLVLKGICTEEEMQILQVEAQRDLLRGILQAAENQRLQQQQSLRDVVVPKKPGLIVAKH